MKPQQGEYFAGVDGLRAIAVVAVILYHLDARLVPAGFLGVDVFFVISGFVVCHAMTHIRGDTLRAFAATFYARRLARIAPALVACLLVTALLASLLIPNAWLSDHSRTTGVAAFLGLSNLLLALHAEDYFAPRAEFNAFAHTWSLGVEEQFYLLFPLVFFLFRARPRTGATLLGVLVLASLAVAAWWTPGAHARAFYLLPARFWELGCGAALFLAMTHWRPALRERPLLADLLAACGVAALITSFGLAPPARVPFPWAIPAVAGTMALVMVAVARAGRVQALLAAAPLIAVGKLSYSLYLWHWPFVVLFRWTVGIETTVQKLVALALTAVFALASYLLVERPVLRASIPRSLPHPRVVLAGVALLVVSAGLAGSILLAQRAISLSVVNRSPDWHLHRTKHPEEGSLPCRLATMEGDLEGLHAKVFTPQGCERKGTLYAAGDSHGDAMRVLLRVYAQQSGREVVLLTQGGCGILDLRGMEADTPAACRAHTQRVFRLLERRLRPGDVVFLPSLRLPRLSEAWGTRSQPAPVTVPDRAVAEALGRVQDWERRGARVVFPAPTPVFRAAAFRCADWFNRANPACDAALSVSRLELEASRAPVLAAMRTIADASAARIWDPGEVLCRSECQAVQDGRPVFFDGDHLAGHGNVLLVPAFHRFMQELDAATPSLPSPFPAAAVPNGS